MNLNDYLRSKGVVITYTLPETIYENMENVLEKEVWICDYRCGDDIFKKPIRNIPPKKVKIYDEKLAKKNIYYSPIYFREIKGDKILKAEIAPFDNTGYRGRTGTSVNIFDTKLECRECYKEQLMVAKKKYDNEFIKIEGIYNTKIDWIVKELRGVE